MISFSHSILFQVVATFEDSEMAEEEPIGDALDGHLAELWSTARPNDEPLVDKRRLRQVRNNEIRLSINAIGVARCDSVFPSTFGSLLPESYYDSSS